MQENEFEKQVKSTIDEFRLRPSAPVWMNILEEIREKKRRRILLMIPVFAVLLGLGYFTWQSYYHNDKIVSTQQKNELADKKENKDIDVKTTEQTKAEELKKQKDVVDNTKPGDKSTATASEAMHSDKNIPANKITVANKKPLVQGQALVKTSKKNKISGHIELQSGSVNQKAKKDLNAVPELLAMNKKKIADNAEHIVAVETSNAPVDAILQPDNIPVPVEYNPQSYSLRNTINSNELIITQIPALKSNNDFKNARSIKWGLDFSVGSSSRIEQPFKVVSADKAIPASANFNNNPVSLGTTTTVSGGLLVLPPSEVKPGVSFKIGVVVDKPLSKRLSISTGLHYVYASDKISIGKSTYSGANTVALQNTNYLAAAVAQSSYSGAQKENFTNKYHFIELPVNIHWNLIPKWKTPVTWNAGAVISRMISSNALLYDEAWGGIYYKGENIFSKTQFSITTGFSFHFTGTNHWQWSIGPEVSMYTTKLFQSVSDKNNHIVYGGINFQLLLPHKRR
ncbi:MAG: outer membrane beta-barrel protein [Bacteroidota bacterium]